MKIKLHIQLVAVFTAACLFNSDACGDIVVNIDATTNGSPGTFGSDADVEQFLEAGDYTFKLVNDTSGHDHFHPDALYTAWRYKSGGDGWVTLYRAAYDDGDPSNDSLSSPPYAGPDLLGGGSFTESASAIEAFDETEANDRLSMQVHIPTDQTLGFFVPDDSLHDNAGGASVLIEPFVIPEPGAVGILAAAGLVMTLSRRRRRK